MLLRSLGRIGHTCRCAVLYTQPTTSFRVSSFWVAGLAVYRMPFRSCGQYRCPGCHEWIDYCGTDDAHHEQYGLRHTLVFAHPETSSSRSFSEVGYRDMSVRHEHDEHVIVSHYKRMKPRGLHDTGRSSY